LDTAGLNAWLNNNSDACVWVTYYWSYRSEAHWRIGRSGWVRPLAQDQYFVRFNHTNLGPQLRIRTQVMSTVNGACTGNTGRPDIETKFNFSPIAKQSYCDARARLVGSKAHGYRLEQTESKCS